MSTTQLIKRLFTVKEYHHMIEAGILTKDDKVELIRGEIVQMPPLVEGIHLMSSV